MIIISYATKNTPYMQIIKQKLLPTLKKFNLRYDIDYPEDFGSWQKNTHYKAEFIKKMLLKHKEPVVFLDADATIEQYPKLLFELKDYDISYHELDWMKMWRRQEGHTKREVLSGTLYLSYNTKILQFLDDWILENNANNRWEQKNMQKILIKWKSKLNIYYLPYSYITIMVGNGQISPHMIKAKDVVILHHQASRKYRNYKKKA
jgi:hypothetical protein